MWRWMFQRSEELPRDLFMHWCGSLEYVRVSAWNACTHWTFQKGLTSGAGKEPFYWGYILGSRSVHLRTDCEMATSIMKVPCAIKSECLCHFHKVSLSLATAEHSAQAGKPRWYASIELQYLLSASKRSQSKHSQVLIDLNDSLCPHKTKGERQLGNLVIHKVPIECILMKVLHQPRLGLVCWKSKKKRYSTFSLINTGRS